MNWTVHLVTLVPDLPFLYFIFTVFIFVKLYYELFVIVIYIVTWWQNEYIYIKTKFSSYDGIPFYNVWYFLFLLHTQQNWMPHLYLTLCMNIIVYVILCTDLGLIGDLEVRAKCLQFCSRLPYTDCIVLWKVHSSTSKGKSFCGLFWWLWIIFHWCIWRWLWKWCVC